jgi:hypothetical protein
MLVMLPFRRHSGGCLNSGSPSRPRPPPRQGHVNPEEDYGRVLLDPFGYTPAPSESFQEKPLVLDAELAVSWTGA